METGDRPSRDGENVVAKNAEKPSEQAIRGRLIDRRMAFDKAEEDRRLINRMRRRLDARSGASASGRTRGAPLAAISRAARGLRDRPIIAFLAAASISAGILVPLAVSSFAPLPGEMPEPHETAFRTPPAAERDIEPAGFSGMSEGSAAAAPDGGDGQSDPATDARAQAATGGSTRADHATGERPVAAPPEAPQTTARASADGSSDTALLDDASLRRADAAAPADAATAVPGTPAEAPGETIIDPVAAALALRLPTEMAPQAPGLPDLDPTATGAIGAAAPIADEFEGAAPPASSEALPPPETAGAANGLVTVSPSILLSTGEADEAPAAAQPPVPAAGTEPAEAAGEEASQQEAALPAATGRATASVNMRAEPTNDGAIVAILGKGDTVTVVSCQGWCEIESADGQKGFVYEKFIERGTKG
ncbi:SH3 domain-containing protein [Aurantimonas sp. 22II-16-19i]|uniref:SH3 domain-containing protein n=1 Tax=Aurantimonas sp. 22II-16-19i TaxID=1317114 RepID=UPI0009F7F671|nr:SH3 domain-containing protein [Aurantimonas sp. 22II-16-19i]ORE90171.1 SH3 type 3 domain-containing protein [Aurantimonas sp. 22II-16-19i]